MATKARGCAETATEAHGGAKMADGYGKSAGARGDVRRSRKERGERTEPAAKARVCGDSRRCTRGRGDGRRPREERGECAETAAKVRVYRDSHGCTRGHEDGRRPQEEREGSRRRPTATGRAWRAREDGRRPDLARSRSGSSGRPQHADAETDTGQANGHGDDAGSARRRPRARFGTEQADRGARRWLESARGREASREGMPKPEPALGTRGDTVQAAGQT